MSNYPLELDRLDKNFGEVKALEQVSFNLQAGRHLAIIGSSGCGKSTLLRLIAGLDEPDHGNILMDGELVSSAGKIIRPPHKRHSGLVFQDLALWPNLSVFNNISLALSASKIAKTERYKRIAEVLKLCGVESLQDRRPAQISGGQQQRVALARAIVSRPHFLLLDEPFSGLDLVTKQTLMSEITRLAEAQNITILLVTHDPFEASFLAHDVIILENGKIGESGTFSEILSQSKTPIMEQFRQHIQGVDL